MFATDSVGEMASGQRKPDDRNGDHQTDQTECGGGVGARVNFPFDGDREHLSADERKQIAARVEAEVASTKRRIRIVARRSRYRCCTFRRTRVENWRVTWRNGFVVGHRRGAR